ncbi:MAG: hypothetical protein J0H19_00370 [Rhodospirillales bacterium]|nr:hypothetical protein [Rhodospirillales bacterium]
MDNVLPKVTFRSLPSTEASLALAQIRWLEASLSCLLEQIQLKQVPPDEVEHRLRMMRARVESALAGEAD